MGKDTKIQNLISGLQYSLLITSLLAFSTLYKKYKKLSTHMVRLTRPSPLVLSSQSFLPQAPKFLNQIPLLFIIKICFTIKVNTICGAGRDTRNLCRKFGSQGLALKILSPRVAYPRPQGT